MAVQTTDSKASPVVLKPNLKSQGPTFKADFFRGKKFGKGSATGFDPARFKTQHKG